MSFMTVFGNTQQEQLGGVAAFVVVVCILIIATIVVVSPIMGDKSSETTLSTEIIKALIGLIGTSFGFLVGNMKKSEKEE